MPLSVEDDIIAENYLYVIASENGPNPPWYELVADFRSRQIAILVPPNC